MEVNVNAEGLGETGQSPSNLFSSFSTYLTSTVGVTILLMPKLFDQAGVLVGALEIVSMGTCIYFSTSMLCRAAALKGTGSFHETMAACLPRGLGVANVLLLLLLFGNILVYQTFALKNLVPVMNAALGLNLVAGTPQFRLLAAGVAVGTNLLILPFLFARRLRFVKVLSNICATAVVLSFVQIIVLFCFPSWFGLQKPQADWTQLPLAKLDGAFVCVGYYLLSFCFQQIAVEVSRDIRPQSATDKVIFWNCLVSVGVYLVVSVVGYLLVCTDPNISQMNNFITYLILERKTESKALFVIDLGVIFSVVFANILNYIPTIKYLKARFNRKPDQLLRLGSFPRPELLLNDSSLQTQVSAYSFRTHVITWLLFISVLVTAGLIVVFDLKMDFVFNLVSAVGGPAVLIVLPALFYRRALATEAPAALNTSQKTKIGLVLSLGVLFWVLSVAGVFYA